MANVILFSLIGGLVSLVAALILFRDKKEADRVAKYATPFAAGVLLGAAFSDLLPEAIETNGESRDIMLVALLAFLGFFFLERFLHFFHHHHEHKGSAKASSSLIIIGDTLHNALDGVAIGAAFLVNVPTGIVATLAVALHEIPQEIGDFGLLIRNGMPKRKVVIVNVLSALATTVAAVVTYQIGGNDSSTIPYLLAITAGFFIYIAASDIIPEIHSTPTKKFDPRPWLLLAGAVLIIIISPIAHKYIDNGTHEESTRYCTTTEDGGLYCSSDPDEHNH